MKFKLNSLGLKALCLYSPCWGQTVKLLLIGYDGRQARRCKNGTLPQDDRCKACVKLLNIGTNCMFEVELKAPHLGAGRTFQHAQDFYTITQMLMCGRMSSKTFVSCMDNTLIYSHTSAMLTTNEGDFLFIQYTKQHRPLANYQDFEDFQTFVVDFFFMITQLFARL